MKQKLIQTKIFLEGSYLFYKCVSYEFLLEWNKIYGLWDIIYGIKAIWFGIDDIDENGKLFKGHPFVILK